ncbi:MAG: TonB-dependent receptor, partial [Pseudomonadota bacterium]|nr:TonB-dependent receptor [Pseudomonadota bacterium]
FFPDVGFFRGNPNLGPETSHTVDLGLRGDHGWGGWSVNGFYTRIDDIIIFDVDTVRNLDQADIPGLELELHGHIGGWTAAGFLTLQDPEDDAGNRLPRRTRKSLRLDLDRGFGKASAGLSVIAEGERFDDAGNRVRLAGFGLVNLRAGYDLGRGLAVQGRVNNLFDKDYATAAGFNNAGREFFVTLSYRLE